MQDEKVFKSACKRWLDEKAKSTSCKYRKILSQWDLNDFKSVAQGDRCRNIHLYGAFHAFRLMFAMPFEYSADAAESFQAQSVCYDGASCMIFDDIEKVRACAQDLSRTKGCRYEISGNQNRGSIRWIPFCQRAHEPPDSMSKLTAIIDEATVKLRFWPCTPEGETCGVDPFPKTNTKWCEHQGILVEQRCCPKGKKTGSLWGKWSAPGEACPKT